jgi:predicted Fe-Mo cluster-binding NifX family protein
MGRWEEELDIIKRKKLERVLKNLRNGGGQTTVRIVIPVSDERDLDAEISGHFGRAPYFAVLDLDPNGEILEKRTVPNVGGQFGGTGQRADQILALKPDAVITFGMGPRGLSRFQYARVAVLKANVNTVREAVEAYNRDELVELTEGCHEARHR